MNLGGRVAQERKARGLTQQQLADKVSPRVVGDEKGGLTQQALDRLEKRDSNKSEFAVGLADALGVSLRWLLTGAGNKAEGDWPFPRVQRGRWDACDDQDRGYVQAAMNRALDECEAMRQGSSGKRLANGQ